MLVLPVEVNQNLSDRLQHRECHRRVVDEAPTLPFCRDLTAHDQLRPIGLQLVPAEQTGKPCIASDAKDTLNHRPLSVSPNYLDRCPLAKNQP